MTDSTDNFIQRCEMQIETARGDRADLLDQVAKIDADIATLTAVIERERDGMAA